MKIKNGAILAFFFLINFILSLSDQGKLLPFILTLQTPFLVLIFLKKTKLKIPFPKIWFLFFLYLLINLVFSVNKQTSWDTILIFLASWLIFIIAHNLNLDKKTKNLALNLFLATSFLLTLPYLWFRFRPLTKTFSALTLIHPITGHVHLSSVILLALIASFLVQKYFLSTWFFICLTLSSSVSSLLTLSIIASICLFNPFKFKFLDKSKIKKYLKTATYISFLILIVFLIVTSFSPELLNQIDPVLGRKGLFGSRHWYWGQAVKGFLSKPVTGYGLSNFGSVSIRFQTLPYQFSSYAHSFYFRWLVETGLMGTAVLALLAWQIFKQLDLKTKTNQIIFLIILGSSIESAFDYGWQFPSILFLLAFWLGLLIKSSPKTPSWSKLKFTYLALVLIFIASAQVFSLSLVQQKKYPPSLIFNPFQQDSYVKSFDQQPAWLINWLFKENSNFWNELAKKYQYSGNTQKEVWSKEKEVALFSKTAYPYRYLELARIYLKNNQVSSAIELTLQTANHPPELGQEKEIVEIIKKLLTDKKNTRPATLLTKLDYYIGLFYFNQNQPKEAEQLWQKLALDNPEWSFFHVELANLYWHSNQKQKAINRLENTCLKYEFPRKYCLEYLEEYRNEEFKFPGIMQGQIEKYFNKR